MNIEIANRLVELRKKSGLSQEELADKLGVSRQAVSKWETASASPDTDNLICLARIYGVSLDDLLNTEETIDEIVKDKKIDEDSKKKKGKDQIHIGADGIHVISEDGDEVHISGSGIHINDNAHEINTYKDNVEKAITSVMGVFATVAYILLSIFFPLWVGGWGFWWLLFVAIPIPACFYRAITKKKFSEVPVPLITTIVFFCLGFIGNAWHPGWCVFLAIPVYYVTVHPIDKMIRRNVYRKAGITVDPDIIDSDEDINVNID